MVDATGKARVATQTYSKLDADQCIVECGAAGALTPASGVGPAAANLGRAAAVAELRKICGVLRGRQKFPHPQKTLSYRIGHLRTSQKMVGFVGPPKSTPLRTAVHRAPRTLRKMLGFVGVPEKPLRKKTGFCGGAAALFFKKWWVLSGSEKFPPQNRAQLSLRPGLAARPEQPRAPPGVSSG